MSSLCYLPVFPVFRQLSTSLWIKQWNHNSPKDEEGHSEKWEPRPREVVLMDRNVLLVEQTEIVGNDGEIEGSVVGDGLFISQLPKLLK